MVCGPVADDRLGGLPHCLRRNSGAQNRAVYVANWFYLSFILTIAMPYREQSAVPVAWNGSLSFSAFAGVRDA